MKKTLFAAVAVLAFAVVIHAASVRTIEVQVGATFTPATIHVKKGVPVRIEFTRTGEPTCAESIVFPQLKMEKPLAAGKSAVFEFTPAHSGDLQFACGMKMMKGKVVVE